MDLNIGSYDHIFKVIVIGESSAGKSALTLQLSEREFYPDFSATVAIDFRMYCLEIEQKRIRLQIWDTAGQERFQSVASAFYRGANGVMLCFDITSKSTFEKLSVWLHRVRTLAMPHVVTILVGCKLDLADKREVSLEEATAWATENGMEYIETSAKNAHNIAKAFEMMTQRMMAVARERGVLNGSNSLQENLLTNRTTMPPGDTSSRCCS